MAKSTGTSPGSASCSTGRFPAAALRYALIAVDYRVPPNWSTTTSIAAAAAASSGLDAAAAALTAYREAGTDDPEVVMASSPQPTTRSARPPRRRPQHVGGARLEVFDLVRVREPSASTALDVDRPTRPGCIGGLRRRSRSSESCLAETTSSRKARGRPRRAGRGPGEPGVGGVRPAPRRAGGTVESPSRTPGRPALADASWRAAVADETPPRKAQTVRQATGAPDRRAGRRSVRRSGRRSVAAARGRAPMTLRLRIGRGGPAGEPARVPHRASPDRSRIVRATPRPVRPRWRRPGDRRPGGPADRERGRGPAHDRPRGPGPP